jgi:Ca2+-binding EF-hand superfamily protein
VSPDEKKIEFLFDIFDYGNEAFSDMKRLIQLVTTASASFEAGEYDTRLSRLRQVQYLILQQF